MLFGLLGCPHCLLNGGFLALHWHVPLTHPCHGSHASHAPCRRGHDQGYGRGAPEPRYDPGVLLRGGGVPVHGGSTCAKVVTLGPSTGHYQASAYAHAADLFCAGMQQAVPPHMAADQYRCAPWPLECWIARPICPVLGLLRPSPPQPAPARPAFLSPAPLRTHPDLTRTAPRLQARHAQRPSRVQHGRGATGGGRGPRRLLLTGWWLRTGRAAGRARAWPSRPHGPSARPRRRPRGPGRGLWPPRL